RFSAFLSLHPVARPPITAITTTNFTANCFMIVFLRTARSSTVLLNVFWFKKFLLKPFSRESAQGARRRLQATFLLSSSLRQPHVVPVIWPQMSEGFPCLKQNRR